MSVSDAAEVLLRDWPTPASKTRLAAMAACLAVIRGEKPPRVARQAFIVAAKERENPARRTDLIFRDPGNPSVTSERHDGAEL
nr:DUF982 domain-containing protein [Mesorhizobium sp.]